MNSAQLGSADDPWSVESLCRHIEQQHPWQIRRDSIIFLGKESRLKFAAVATTQTQEPPFRVIVHGHTYIDLSEQEYATLMAWNFIPYQL